MIRTPPESRAGMVPVILISGSPFSHSGLILQRSRRGFFPQSQDNPHPERPVLVAKLFNRFGANGQVYSRREDTCTECSDW